MRRTSIMAGRIVAIVLAFVLGFFSSFGAVAGVIYLAYSKVNVDKINEWGQNLGLGTLIPTEEIVNPEAEKPLTSVTLQELFAELSVLQQNNLTLNEMITKYGLILTPEIIAALPPSIMDEVPISDLFGENGMDIVLSKVTVLELLNMIPEDIAGTIISNPTRDALSDNTLADIVAMDMGYVFEGIELGYVTGVNYEFNEEEGKYQVVFADPSVPTALELLAPLDLGGILTAVSDNNDGDVLKVIEDSIGDVVLKSLFGESIGDVLMLSNILGEAKLADVIVYNEAEGKYTMDIMSIFNGKKLGTLLGYTEVPLTDSETDEPLLDPETQEPLCEWHDAEGNKVGGIDSVLADIAIDDVLNGTFSADNLLNDLEIADILGFEKVAGLPVYKSDDLTTPLDIPEENEIVVWYDNGVEADKIMSSFAGMTFNEITSDFSELPLSAVLGYYQYGEDWYTWQVKTVGGEPAVVLTAANGVMTEIAHVKIGNMGNIEGEIRNIEVGTLLGYTPVYDGEGNLLHWTINDQGDKATGITAALAGYKVSELSDPDTIDNIRIADVMGYTEENGKWYDGNKEVTGVMGAIAGSSIGTLDSDINDMTIGKMLGYTPVYTNKKDEHGNDVVDSEGNPVQVVDHWVDANGVEVTGVMAAFAGLTVNEMSGGAAVQDAIKKITVADVLGLKYDDTAKVWYEDKDGNGKYEVGVDTKSTGVMAALADTTVGGISSKMETLYIGEMLGYEPVYRIEKDEHGNNVLDSEGNPVKVVDHWLTGKIDEHGNPEKANGVVGALASTRVQDLNTRLQNITVGEILGYSYDSTNDVWYEDDDNDGVYDDGEKVSGVTGALAGTELDGLSGALNNLQIGEIAGYTPIYKLDSQGKPTTEVDYWCNCNNHGVGDNHKEATGILGALAGLTVDGITKENNLSNAIKGITLADAMGYTYDDASKQWYDDTDGDGQLDQSEVVTGVLAVLADKPISNLGTAINDAKLGEILGYTAVDENKDGTTDYWKNGDARVTGFIALVADSTINNVDTEINNSISDTSLQFFLNNGLISLDAPMTSQLDGISLYKNDLVSIPTDLSYPIEFNAAPWNGYVPKWRTQSLSQSFAYIISLLSPSTTVDTGSDYKLGVGHNYISGIDEGVFTYSSSAHQTFRFESTGVSGVYRMYYMNGSTKTYVGNDSNQIVTTTTTPISENYLVTLSPLTYQITIGGSVLGFNAANKTFGLYPPAQTNIYYVWANVIPAAND